MSIRGTYLLYERQPDCLCQALQRNGRPSAPHPALWLAAYPTSSVLFLSACARARCFVSLPTRHPQDPGSNNKPSCLRPKSIYCRCLSSTGILASLAAAGPDSLPALKGGWVWWDRAAQAPAHFGLLQPPPPALALALVLVVCLAWFGGWHCDVCTLDVGRAIFSDVLWAGAHHTPGYLCRWMAI
jgi:hypothetical protein